MKILTKMLLVHWHYFTYEIIDFGEINFLTGKNSSGKSTIIDAMQLVLLGDTSGSYFNKAASAKGNRTLKGYLLGELGDDETSGFRSLRGNTRFTSYIALEFYDDEKDKFFTAGCCFDVYSENDITKLFFLYDGGIHPDGFQDGGKPLDIGALRGYLREYYNGRHETTNVGRDYRTKLYGKLGGLRERFSTLLKRAVSFDPDIDIQKFISDFVCDDQQTVDISHMQENIRSYKRLEAEASVLQDRIDILTQIEKKHNSYTDAKNSEQLYSYLIDRATADMKTGEIQKAEEDALNLAVELSALIVRLAETDLRLQDYRNQRDTLQVELRSNGAAQSLEHIDREIAEKEKQIRDLQNEYDRVMGILVSRTGLWRSSADIIVSKLESAQSDLLQPGLASRISDITDESRALAEQTGMSSLIDAEAVIRLGEPGLCCLSESADRLKSHAIELHSRIRDEQDVIAAQCAQLNAERQSLESGVYKFPQDALDLKDALRSRLRTLAKQDVDVRIVAEVSEIKNDRWRNAVEGYLNTQKFYIIVPDEYFKDALRVFDAIKRDKKIYGTGIVDIEKLRRLVPVADKGSLAEEIVTEDAEVRLFLDYTLGRLQKCDDVRDLRKYRMSITDEGMLYHNYAVRAMNPERWKNPAIGQGAIQRRLDAVIKELEVLGRQITACSSVRTGLDAANRIVQLSDSEIAQTVSGVRNITALPVLQEDVVSLRKNREAIDTSAIDALKARIGDLERSISSLDLELRDGSGTKGTLEEKQRSLNEDQIPALESQLDRLEAAIAMAYTDEWIVGTGAPRYSRELSSRGGASQIAGAFPREQTKARNVKDDSWDDMVATRSKYNEKYKMGYDIKTTDNDVYSEALHELSENRLPEYQVKIGDAKEKALEQFQEDFISRIQNNITNAKRHIEDLNSALKGASFGEDIYRFRITPNPDNKRYYDMIMDDMITEGGYTLLSLQFNDKYKEEIAELFSIITNEDGGAGSSGYERRVHEFTDFKTYLFFDLEVIGQDGVSQRLSKTYYKKSGGETQTPFYIAVLASFAQLYRTGRDSTYKTSRLIIFDEAFSKMDGERIKKSIELLRRFGFQVILSAPPEKVDDIAGLVDKITCVIRKGTSISIGCFDPARFKEEVLNEM